MLPPAPAHASVDFPALVLPIKIIPFLAFGKFSAYWNRLIKSLATSSLSDICKYYNMIKKKNILQTFEI